MSGRVGPTHTIPSRVNTSTFYKFGFESNNFQSTPFLVFPLIMSCPCRFIHYFPDLLFSCTYLPVSFPSILSSLILSFLLALPPSWSLQRWRLQLAVCSNVKLAALQLATFPTTNRICWSTCNLQPCYLQPCSLPLGLQPTSFNLAALQPSSCQ